MKVIYSIIIICALTSFHLNEQRIITGRVMDENQSPIKGAMVNVLNTQTNSITNKNGQYRIAADNNSTLVFSSPGYENAKVRIGLQSVININLKWALPEEKEIELALAEEYANHSMVRTTRPKLAKRAYRGLSNNTSFDDTFIPNHNTEEYDFINENIFKTAKSTPLSTLSIDVDNASYSNIRRMILNGQKPYADAVRIEEMINYFSYNYKNPTGQHPFSINTEISAAPWNSEHQLIHVGIQGKKLNSETKVNSNLVFLIDVSGSMNDSKKLPLLKSAMKLLVNQLSAKDRIAIVTYAGAAGLVLPSTPASEKDKILSALDRMSAGGSTAGGAGIKLAYKVAVENLISHGNNRVILATDGDFNTGTSSTAEMVRLIQEKRTSGVYLTIAGFGMGNYKDGRMEQISNAGNGNYYYIDSFKEANKVFGQEMQSTLFTIAKDVKIQLEFNPAHVQAYRLIGYENRKLNEEDFNNDKVDAGELGAGHTVTALYEIIPTGVTSEFLGSVNPLKYQDHKSNSIDNELMNISIRYKPINSSKSVLLAQAVNRQDIRENTSDNFRFSAAVAQFGMIMRDSKFIQQSSLNSTILLANGAKGNDELGYRHEFIDMIRNYAAITDN